MSARSRVLSALALIGTLGAACTNLDEDPTGAPQVSITSPANGYTAVAGTPVVFTARVDDETPDLTVIQVMWTSDVDDVLNTAHVDAQGIATFTTGQLSAATHTITATATDEDGDQGLAQVTVVIDSNSPPSIVLESPLDGASFPSDTVVPITGTVDDGQDAAEDLRVSVTSTLSEDPLVTDLQPASDGSFSVSVFLPEGLQTLTATVTDRGLQTASQAVSLAITEANATPTCAFTFPIDGEVIDSEVVLTADVGDEEDPPQSLTVRFDSTLDGNLGNPVPAADGTVELATTLTSGDHVLALTVRDSQAEECVDQVHVVVSGAPVVEITSPPDGSAVGAGTPVTFVGTVDDSEDAPPTLILEWKDTVDGVETILSTAPSGASGSTSVTVSAGFDNGIHEISLSATDTTGLTTTATITLIVNGAPSAPVVDLQPDGATTVDDLVAVITTESTDPDGDPVTYRYEWYLGGVVDPAYTSATLPASATAKDHQWRVRVYPTDGVVEGSFAQDQLTVSNSLPTVGSVEITPMPVTDGQTLTAIVTGVFDADDDPVDVNLRWYKNGTSVSGADELLPSMFTRGDQLYVEAKGNDGDTPGEGPATLSSTVTVENALPAAPTVTLSPASPAPGNDLTCSRTNSTDPDGDTLTYRFAWTEDGASRPDLDGVTVVDGLELDSGESWTCTVTPNDGFGDGTPGSATAVVGSLTYPLTLDLADIGTDLDGAIYDDRFGAAVAAADFNRDGFSDLAVGAPRDDQGGTDSGAVFIFFGGPDGFPDGVAASDADVVLTGPAGESALGTELRTGDLDGDGDADLAVGAPNDDTVASDAGAVYVLLGGPGFVDYSDTVDSAADLMLAGQDTADKAGAAFDFVPDIDGDGDDELAIGAPETGSGATALRGTVYLVLGGDFGSSFVSLADADARWDGTAGQARLGQSVAGLADWDGDGVADLAVGSPRDATGEANGGAVYVFSGATLLDASGDLGGAAAVVLGETAEAQFGEEVRGWDSDGDGLTDLVVAALLDDTTGTDAGSVSVFRGADGLSGTFSSASDYDLRVLGEGASANAGRSLAALPDWDGDGQDELVVTEPGANVPSNKEGVACVLLSGQPWPINLSSAALRLAGPGATSQVGSSVAVVPDDDGDGFPGLLIGGERAAGAAASTGAAWAVDRNAIPWP